MSKEMLNKVVEMFDTIKNTSGSKAKEALIKEYGDNILFKEMLLFLYNPYIKTGIGAKKLVKFASFKSDDVQQFDNISDVLEYLKNNNTGKDENVKAVANFINSHGMDCNNGRTHDFLQEYFTEDVKIGATANTINKVFGKGTIPQFKVMLAESLTDHMDYIEGKEHVTLMKYDGVRCTAVKKDGSTIFFTRKGLPIEDMTDLEELFEDLTDGFVYEGELIVHNYKEMKSKDAYKATSKIVRKDGEKLGLSFIAFDYLPVSEFEDGVSTLGYLERYDNLRQELLVTDEHFICLAESLYIGDDISETLKLAEKYIAEGQEGLVVRKADAPYVAKRSKDLLRIKGVKTADLRIIDTEEGTKKSTIGKLGAIVVDYKGYRLKIGSGFTQEERNELWSERNSLVGQIAEIIYTEETSNEQGGLSVRFPRFKGIREIGKEVNID